jgi:hypothetical protein
MIKKVKLHFDSKRYDLFKLEYRNNRYNILSFVKTGLGGDVYEHIGTSSTEEEALNIMKASAREPTRRIEFC